jgi:hypothetical protein
MLPAEKSRNAFSSARYIQVIGSPAGKSGRLLELCRGRPWPASILIGPAFRNR